MSKQFKSSGYIPHRSSINKYNSPANKGTHKAYHINGSEAERPISNIYSAIDTDLARDNLENDMTAADLQEL